MRAAPHSRRWIELRARVHTRSIVLLGAGHELRQLTFFTSHAAPVPARKISTSVTLIRSFGPVHAHTNVRRTPPALFSGLEHHPKTRPGKCSCPTLG